MNRTIQFFIALFVLATVAMAAGAPSIERGNELFKSTSLGTNGKSCEGCHPNGKGLKDAASFDEKKLAKITNKCVVKALKGKAFADGSPELTSLIMYQKTLGTAKAK